MWKTDYPGHDKIYRRLRESSALGWGGDENEMNTQTALRFLNSVFNRESKTASGNLLALGCGDGSVALPLAGKGFEVFGIDISPTAVSWAKEKAVSQRLKADFLVGNVNSLPFSSESFNIVTDIACSHCIIGEDRKLFFREAYRVLKEGGLFILMSMCGDPKEESVKSNFDMNTRCLVVGGIARRYIGLPGGIRADVESAGFEIKFSEVVHDDIHQDDLYLVAGKP
ncbi:class I SAM-dependent methyltransferase [bacterium]|nr:class I SAM-dependent methyltransferase [bacterium]